MSVPPVSVSSTPAFTFVLHDAGETKALQPVMQALDGLKVDYRILADSTARHLLTGNPHLAPLPADVVQLSLHNPWAAATAQAVLDQAVEVPVVITGLVSDFQKRWVESFRRLGKVVVGYYDSFSYSLGGNREEAFRGLLSSMITPSRDTAEFYKRRLGNIPMLPLGQPVLESTSKLMQQPGPDVFRRQLGLVPGLPTLLFVGGADSGYVEAFSLFCQSIRRLTVPVNILLSLHPKADGKVESQLLHQFGLTSRVKTVPKNIQTAQLLGVADVVLSHRSTMAIQAGLNGKQVLEVGPDPVRKDGGISEFDPAFYYGLATRCATSEAFSRAILQALQKQSPAVSGDGTADRQQLYHRLGIPMQATRNIVQYLMSLLPPGLTPEQPVAAIQSP